MPSSPPPYSISKSEVAASPVTAMFESVVLSMGSLKKMRIGERESTPVAAFW